MPASWGPWQGAESYVRAMQSLGESRALCVVGQAERAPILPAFRGTVKLFTAAMLALGLEFSLVIKPRVITDSYELHQAEFDLMREDGRRLALMVRCDEKL